MNNNSGFSVTVLGNASAIPTRDHHPASQLVMYENRHFLIDCGEGTQVSLRRLNLRWKKISTILISHTHADHITGLPGILMLSSQVERTEPLTIIGPPKIGEYVKTSRQVLDMYVNYSILLYSSIHSSNIT